MIFQTELKWDLSNVDGAIIVLSKELKNSSPFSSYLKKLKEKDTFTGKIGESYELTWMHEETFKEIVLIGTGDAESFSLDKMSQALANAIKSLKKKKVSKIGIDFTSIKDVFDEEGQLSRMITETLLLGDYTFDTYLSDKKDFSIEEVFLKGIHFRKNALKEGQILGEATLFARKLTNMPANILTPSKLAEMVIDYGKDKGFEVEVKGLDEIRALKMDAYLAVAKGSTESPQLIIMRYHGNPKSQQRLGLVGKGLTYDSGGLSIKPTPSMVNMKDDMAGSSAVIGAMGAIAQMGLEVNVTTVVAACENMISGHSYKPGDIISSMAGKSIFIGNTDAEGRLTLVDAITYIQTHESVDKLVDIATLTGAAVQCLGSEASAVLSNDDTFYSMVEKAYMKAGENQWRLPIYDGYRKLLKHAQADLNNAAGTPGAITAGLFIEAFVKDVPWVHIDIAGTAFKDKEEGIYSKGGTGAGVRPLYFLAKKLSK